MLVNGYWNEKYFQDNYWNELYWQAYGVPTEIAFILSVSHAEYNVAKRSFLEYNDITVSNVEQNNMILSYEGKDV